MFAYNINITNRCSHIKGGINMKNRRVKIVNMKKFIRSIVLIFILILLLSLIIVKSTLSHKEIKYKEFNISNGETLWSIASNEQKYNSYYQNKDIRDIIYDLIKVNDLNNSQIYVDQKIIIPEY